MHRDRSLVQVQEGEQPSQKWLGFLVLELMDYFVYILYSASIDKYYVGRTENFENRLLYHNSGVRNKIWTKRGMPWVRYLLLENLNQRQSYQLEAFIKKQKSRKFIERLGSDSQFLKEFLGRFSESG